MLNLAYFKDLESCISTLPCCGCDLLISDKPMHLIDMTPNESLVVMCLSSKDLIV